MESDFKFGINLGSPHQVEGSPPLTDYTEPELRLGTHTLQKGCWDNPELFTKDLWLAKQLGVSVVRFGIEWARVEPYRYTFDRKILSRYKDMVQEVGDSGLLPMVNLHHFTLPQHVASYGGWANPKSVFDFLTYVMEVKMAIGEVPFIITINEPSVFLTNGYLKGMWPPFLRRSGKLIPAQGNVIRAHNNAYRLIKEDSPQTQVGATEAIRGFSPANSLARAEARFREYFWNTYFFRHTQNDFYGVNYFKSYPLRFGSDYQPVPQGLDVDEPTFNAPFAFEEAMRRFAGALPSRPIFITENGVRTNNEVYQGEFIQAHVARSQSLREQGLPIVGIMPWTETDNFEWFEPLGDCRMGLVKVDFETGERIPKKSFKIYQELCHSNVIK